MMIMPLWFVLLLAWPYLVSALGQKPIISFNNKNHNDTKNAFRIVGGSKITRPQIRVSSDENWGVIRAAGDLVDDFNRVVVSTDNDDDGVGFGFTLSNGEKGAERARYEYKPAAANYTHYSTNGTEYFDGPGFNDPSAKDTVIIVGTLGYSSIIGELVAGGKLNVSEIEGKWESFITQIVESPIQGCEKAVVIAGSDPRGTIFGIYDISEQIGVSPWYWWADVPVKKHEEIYVTLSLSERKVQGPPSVRYRGIFINDEQPGLSGWVQANYEDTAFGVGYNREFYPRVYELLLRLRANYLWPAIWGSMLEVDDPANQPLADAWEIVLGSSHTEPMMRAQNEFGTFYTDKGLGPWAYNLNNKTIDEYFVYGAQRAKPYANNSLWTMGMRGSGDTAIEGLGVDAIVALLEAVVKSQRNVLEDVLDVKAADVPQMWCLYKEVMSYLQEGLEIPEDITLLWADDNWGNLRRVPIDEEKMRRGSAGVYYHFDYVGDTRNYKWINTIQLEKTAEQMQLAYTHGADRIWIVNVGDLKPLEIPISHFLDIAYDVERWGVTDVRDWTIAWATREFGPEYAEEITDIMTRYGMYAARRKFELVEPYVYSVVNYNEGDAILQQWQTLADDAQELYDRLDEGYKPAFFEMVLHPILGGQIIHQVHIGAEKNMVYANQHRNSANDLIGSVLATFQADGELTARWDNLLDGKWRHMLDQTHFGYDGYWQQPMRNVLPAMAYVQNAVSSIAGNVGIAVEGLNASIPGDDKYHSNSGNTLVLPPLDPYGPKTRWFDVFSRGTKDCGWSATVDIPWVRLSHYEGTVGPDNGTDTRVLVSVDWPAAPQVTNTTTANIEFDTTCGKDGFTRWFGAPVVQVPVNIRKVPSAFTSGFVESDKTVSIEGPNYQRIHNPPDVKDGISYLTLENYGRTNGGVTLWPQTTPPQSPSTAPALEYDVYLFTPEPRTAITLHLSPTQNYLSDKSPLEFAVSLFPVGAEEEEETSPQTVRFVPDSIGPNMPQGWARAVGDSIWGLGPDHHTTTRWNVTQPGPYTLRVWGLAPSVIVQKIVVDLGGVRPSYLGPPESFLVGRDEFGVNARTSFAHGLEV
ncbi:glycoside hydrolase family 115 protein [Poronia punctata]|nr:glycoside hydrolase family 115 protein [Poronia punctata]